MSDIEILMLSYKEPARFAEIFNRHSGRLLAIARRSLGSKDEAEDVVQETFVRVYKHGSKFLEKGGDFKLWSNGILRNCIIDQIRKRARKEISLTEEMENMVAAQSDHADFESSNYISSIFKMIGSSGAEVLHLRFVLGKSFKEIGKIMGIKSNTARVRAHRAKKDFMEVHNRLNMY